MAFGFSLVPRTSAADGMGYETIHVDSGVGVAIDHYLQTNTERNIVHVHVQYCTNISSPGFTLGQTVDSMVDLIGIINLGSSNKTQDIFFLWYTCTL